LLEVSLVPIQSNEQSFIVKVIKRLILPLILTCCASFVSAQSYSLSNYGGEETILIEKEVSQKIPYSRIARAVVKRIFNVNVESMFTGGKNKKTAFVRNFSEYADRTKYRLGVRKDKVEVKFSLNF